MYKITKKFKLKSQWNRDPLAIIQRRIINNNASLSACHRHRFAKSIFHFFILSSLQYKAHT